MREWRVDRCRYTRHSFGSTLDSIRARALAARAARLGSAASVLRAACGRIYAARQEHLRAAFEPHVAGSRSDDRALRATSRGRLNIETLHTERASGAGAD